MRRLAGVVCATLCALGAPAAADEPAPAQLRATVVLEPPRVGIGALFDVEVAVVTPPGHHVAPAPTPKAVPGLVVVDAERPSVEQQPGRWVHRQRFRARASATGPLTWPALELAVEAPDGTTERIVAAERPFEVVSELAEQPERRSPFGLRSPRSEAGAERGPWLPALLGSLATLAALALFAGVRRVRAQERDATAAAEAEPADAARAAVLDALAHAEGAAADPVRAADLASQALREWSAVRFRAPFLRTATTEEIAASPPPFLLAARHSALVEALRGLDATRFPPAGERAGAELTRALAAARAFVDGVHG